MMSKVESPKFVIFRVARKALFRVWRRACARRALLRGGMGRGEDSRPDGVELKRIAEQCARAEGVGLAEGKARAAKRSQEPARSGASQFSWLKPSSVSDCLRAQFSWLKNLGVIQKFMINYVP